jgi:HK97 family phage major capsid protein
MSMNAAEARNEINNLFKKAAEIENRYPDGPITGAEDETEVKRLLSEIDALEEKLTAFETAEQRKERIQRGMRDYNRPAEQMRHAQGDASWEQPKSKGQQFIESAEYKQRAEQGMFHSENTRNEFSVPLAEGTKLMQSKALVYSGTGVGGPMVLPDYLSGLYEILQRELTLLDLIPTGQTSSSSVSYLEEKTYTNNAAFTAEATVTTGTTGTKPESVLEFQRKTALVHTLAHWIPVTNQMLADAPAVRSIIDARLRLGLYLTLETQIISGDGTGENFLGLITAGSGIQQRGIGTDSIQDAIFKAMQDIRVTGLARPNAVVLHPNDWTAVRLARENAATGTLGGYLFGPPSQSGPVTMWGLPVVMSMGLTENTGLVGDFGMGCMLFDREQPQLRVGWINDQFVRNMQTILDELRAAFVIFRPSCFEKVTGI